MATCLIYCYEYRLEAAAWDWTGKHDKWSGGVGTGER